MYRTLRHAIVILGLLPVILGSNELNAETKLPLNLQVVLDNTDSLRHSRNRRLPLFVLPISNSLSGLGDADAKQMLKELDARGIGYSVDWNHNEFNKTLAEGIRIGRWQRELGQPVTVNANACLYSFFDGSEQTLHIDKQGRRFADHSHGGKLGCPFALEHRVPVIKERVEKFLRAYSEAELPIDFIFADWEIDGPIEWNEAWKSGQKCEKCCQEISGIDDFRVFQSRLRSIRSHIQRVAFGDNVTHYFPQALVGNYGTYPHGGHRYWYDYFEKEPTDGIPFRVDQRAKYREWAHEFDSTGYTFGMPVVYTWYPTFDWYDFQNTDYRWFYNMLLVGSNAGKHTDRSIPLIPFVHWHTTAPPQNAHPAVRQFGREAYQELLWHLLLRGHDTFFLWCLPDELADEIKLVHEVYSESLGYSGFIERGTPVNFDVPTKATSAVSGLRLANRVLVRQTDFRSNSTSPSTVLRLDDGAELQVASNEGMQIVEVEKRVPHPGLIMRDGKPTFPIGFYEMPSDDAALKEMADAGVNLIRCGNRAALDRAHAVGMSGWAPLSFPSGATPALKKQIETLVDHPALAVWEGPDEIIWTFTAYSFLKDRAGFTRDDWNQQKKIAVDYSEKEAAKIMPAMREAVQLIRRLDKRKLPVWINEAADSDVRFARQYMPFIDITGCDYYAVRKAGTDLQSVGRLVDRWHAIGQGKPVWMVLQGFSWHNVKQGRGRLYPHFKQTRFMVYDSIVHGAKGIFYWGSNTIDDPKFRESLYAMTSELQHLQPFLVTKKLAGVQANVIDDLFDLPGLGVRTALFKANDDFLLLLVNEDDHRHLGVDVQGLEPLNGRTLSLLYGDENLKVRDGRFVVRMQPYDVKLFSTNAPRYESSRSSGRDY